MQTFLIISFQGNIQSSKRFLFLCALPYFEYYNVFKMRFQGNISASRKRFACFGFPPTWEWQKETGSHYSRGNDREVDCHADFIVSQWQREKWKDIRGHGNDGNGCVVSDCLSWENDAPLYVIPAEAGIQKKNKHKCFYKKATKQWKVF
jgi:hypothetical protein